MNIALWVIAGVLAAAFAAAGLMKLVTPREKLAENMTWANEFSDAQVKGIGLAELLGAIGLILPAAFDVVPILVPLAAAGLVVTMVGAAVFHLRRGDAVAELAPSVVLGVLAAVVAIGRFGPEAF